MLSHTSLKKQIPSSSIILLTFIFVLNSFAAEKTPGLLPVDTPSPDIRYVYKVVDNPKIELEIHAFFPPNSAASSKKPAIVFFHGGSWDHGGPSMHYHQAKTLADRGFMAFSAKYRLINRKTKGGNSPRECVKDAKSAIRWVRENAQKFGIDPQKIAAAGASAGGHLAAATATLSDYDEQGEDLAVSSRPNSIVLIESVLDNGPKGWGHRIVEEYWQSISPFHNIKKGHPPTLIVDLKGNLTDQTDLRHGVAFRYAERVKEVGTLCETYAVDEGGPHMASMLGKHVTPTALRIADFFVKLDYIDAQHCREINKGLQHKEVYEADVTEYLAYLKKTFPKRFDKERVNVRSVLRSCSGNLYQIASDESVIKMHKMNHFVYVDLRSAAISDKALESLKEMPQLRVVKLDKSKVTGVGLAHLRELPFLDTLGLAHFTRKEFNAGVSHLQTMPFLKTLDLYGSSVTGEDLTPLNSCPSLISLNLRNCGALNDQSVKYLGQLKGLKSLNLQDTKLTDSALEEIHSLLPDCLIISK
jgi:acetyl esterase